MDFIEIGGSPSEEDCINVLRGADYLPAMRAECGIFKDQLERTSPVPDDVQGWFFIKTFPHDFGSYMEVVAVYDENDEASTNWAFGVEAKAPNEWDSFARASRDKHPDIQDYLKTLVTQPQINAFKG